MRIRITFAKTGPLRYTGHLDLHKIWERSARRAGLPLAYSQGFHPQPRIQLAAALPLGFASRCEIVDLWLEGEALPTREQIQDAVPAGLHLETLEVIPDRSPALQTLVDSAEYTVILLEPVDEAALRAALAGLLAEASLPRTRRGKTYDLRPLIEQLAFESQPAPSLHMRLAARAGATGRPEEVLDLLGIPLESTRVERTRLLITPT